MYKVVWLNLLMNCEYDANFKNGKRAEFKTERAADKWAMKQNGNSFVYGAFRDYRVEIIAKVGA